MSFNSVTIRKDDGSQEMLQPDASGRSFTSRDGKFQVSKPQGSGSQKTANMYVGEEFKQIPCQAVPGSADLICQFQADTGKSIEIRFAETAPGALASRSAASASSAATPLPPPQTVLASSVPSMAPGGQVAVADRQSILEQWAAADGRIAGANPKKVAIAVIKVADGHFGKRPISESYLRAYYEGYVAKEMAKGGRAPAYSPTPDATRPAPTFNPTPSAPASAIRSGLTLSVEQRESKILEWAAADGGIAGANPQKLAKAVIKVVDGHYGKRPIPEQYLRAYYNGYVVKEAAKAGATPPPPPAPAAAPVKKITFGSGWIQIGRPKEVAVPAAAATVKAEPPKVESPKVDGAAPKTAKPEAIAEAPEKEAAAASSAPKSSPDEELKALRAKRKAELAEKEFISEAQDVLVAARRAYDRLDEINEMKEKEFEKVELKELKILWIRTSKFFKLYDAMKKQYAESTSPNMVAIKAEYETANSTFKGKHQNGVPEERIIDQKILQWVDKAKKLKDAADQIRQKGSETDLTHAKWRFSRAYKDAREMVQSVYDALGESKVEDYYGLLDALQREIQGMRISQGTNGNGDKTLRLAIERIATQLNEIAERMPTSKTDPMMQKLYEVAEMLLEVEGEIKTVQNVFKDVEKEKFDEFERQRGNLTKQLKQWQKPLLVAIAAYHHIISSAQVEKLEEEWQLDWLTNKNNRDLIDRKASELIRDMQQLLGPNGKEKRNPEYVVDPSRRKIDVWDKYWRHAKTVKALIEDFNKTGKPPTLKEHAEPAPSIDVVEARKAAEREARAVAEKQQAIHEKFETQRQAVIPHLDAVEAIRTQLFVERGKPKPLPTVAKLQELNRALKATEEALVAAEFERKDLSAEDRQTLDDLNTRITGTLGLVQRLNGHISTSIKTAEAQDHLSTKHRELDRVELQLKDGRNSLGMVRGDRDASMQKKLDRLQKIIWDADAAIHPLEELKKVPEVTTRASSLEAGLKGLISEAQILQNRLSTEQSTNEILDRITKLKLEALQLRGARGLTQQQKNLERLQAIFAELQAIPRSAGADTAATVLQEALDQGLSDLRQYVGDVQDAIRRNSPGGKLDQLKPRLSSELSRTLSTSKDGNELRFSNVSAEAIEKHIEAVENHVSQVYGKFPSGMLIIAKPVDPERSADRIKMAFDGRLTGIQYSLIEDPRHTDPYPNVTLFFDSGPLAGQVKQIRTDIKKFERQKTASVPLPVAPTPSAAPVAPPAVPTPTDTPVPPPVAPTPTEAPAPPPKTATETAESVALRKPDTETATPAVPFKAPKIVGLFAAPPPFVRQNLGRAYQNRIVYTGQFNQGHFAPTSDKVPVVQDHLQQVTQVTKDSGAQRVLVIYRIKNPSLKKVYESMAQKEILVSGVKIAMRERKILSAGDNSDAQILYVILKEGDDPEIIFKNYIRYLKGEH